MEDVIEDQKKKKVPITIITGFLGAGKVLKFIPMIIIIIILDYIIELYFNKKPWKKNCCDSK